MALMGLYPARIDKRREWLINGTCVPVAHPSSAYRYNAVPPRSRLLGCPDTGAVGTGICG
ncbi:hypothetical protein FPZ49_05785 [Paenibacillus cremeus]|uniref:Uncharacterized protein n=1 Tax=Paenibacillus cremeus TaxID=2163881 RepID=A0A559KFT1_9BACL|nr:hypothetical protein FPZ49_05785 [Paenibacillus cremeus]